jgi:hypothetical protein
MKVTFLSLTILTTTLLTSYSQTVEENSLLTNEITQGITMTDGQFIPDPQGGEESSHNGGDTEASTNLNESKTTLKESLEEIERKKERSKSLKSTKQSTSCKSCNDAYLDALAEMTELMREYTDHLNNGGDRNDFESDKGTVTPAAGGGFHVVTSSGLRSSPDQNGELVPESQYSFCSRGGYK